MAATRSSPRTPSKNKGVGPSGTEAIDDGSDHAHKANWDSAAIQIFLECIKEAILAGHRVGTTITKTGYNEIALKFSKRTGRRHDITQLKNKYGSLKKEWQAWNKLMDSSKGVTGIGFDRDTGLFTASEEWWENLKSTNKAAYKFKTKPLEHEDLMRAVFTGATATDKHHWTPGEKPVDVGDGESDSVDSPGLTPFTEPYRPVVNSPPNSPTINLEEAEPGTKRKKGGSSSGKSKKVSSGASVLADSFHQLSKAVEAQKHLTVRHGTGASQKYGIEPCMQRLMAIPDFISTPLFHFACTVLENADYREILMCMPDDENVVGWLAQLQVSKGLSHRKVMWKGESSNYRNYDDVIIELADEEDDIQKNIISDAAQYAMEYYLKYMEKIPCRTSILTGRAWIQELFDGHVGRREQNLHMPLYVFQALCDTLRSDFGLRVPTRPHGLHIEESVAMFIHTLDGCSNRKLQERFQHSGETVSRHFHAVLEAMKLFTEVHCKPTRDQNSRHPYLRSRGKYVPFKHCIGALDGTHVEAVLPARDAGTYYGRKGYPTQNILAVCDFDMCFIFISCGWEGSMHDSRIFNEITENANAPFPHPQEGKYYLVDAGYANKKGYLAPYKKSRYHQAQFRDLGRPDNPRELFNEAHASLRSVVERTFGAWKSRWKFLHNMPDYDFATVQVPLVGASMALHNFIRRHEIAANAHNEHVNCCSVPDDMPIAEGGENMDDGLMVGDTDVDMARVRVRIRDHLFHIRRQGLL